MCNVQCARERCLSVIAARATKNLFFFRSRVWESREMHRCRFGCRRKPASSQQGPCSTLPSFFCVPLSSIHRCSACRSHGRPQQLAIKHTHTHTLIQQQHTAHIAHCTPHTTTTPRDRSIAKLVKKKVGCKGVQERERGVSGLGLGRGRRRKRGWGLCLTARARHKWHAIAQRGRGGGSSMCEKLESVCGAVWCRGLGI